MLEFQADILVEGRSYKAGDQVAESEVPQGCRESMARLGYIRAVPDMTPAVAPIKQGKKAARTAD